MRLILAFVVAVGCFAIEDARAEVLRALVPNEMLGYVDAENMEETVRNAIGVASTRSMNDGNSISLALWKARMLQAYVLLSAALNDADALALVKEQVAWGKEKDRVAEEAGSSEEGGTGQAVMEGSSLVDQTKKRVAVLEERLAKMGGAK